MASTIKVFEHQDASTISVATGRCGVCFEAMSKYTCPRCNLPYCSVACFKNQMHSGCSESFYKDCFIDEMKQSSVNNEEKLRIMKMLKEFEEEDVQIDELSLEERFRNVNLDDSDDVWSKLTLGEREEFRRRLKNGSSITEWKPWWLHHDISLIKEIDEFSGDSECCEATIVPRHHLQVPELSTLLRGNQPSPRIRNNLLDVLYLYAYFCRKHNGDTMNFACEIAHNVISASPFLKNGITATTCEEGIQGAMDNCILLAEDTNDKRLLIEAIKDTYHILMGRDKDNVSLYTEAVIGELHSCCKSLKKDVCKRPSGDLTSKDIFRVIKKLDFLLSWVTDRRPQLLPLAVDVLGIYKEKVKFTKEHEQVEETVKKMREAGTLVNESHPLIQELS